MKKIGRNDPCTCGSGKKYKQCCMQQDQKTGDADIGTGSPGSDQLQSALEHLVEGRLEQAQSLYRQVLVVAPGNADALHYSGLIAHMQGDSQTAIELIGRAIAVTPQDPFAHCNLGNALLSLQQHEAALAAYDAALQYKPDMAQACYNRGTTLLDLQRPAQALESFDRTLQIDPGFVEAHCNRGRALQDLGRDDEAISCYMHALQLKPDHAVAYNNLGRVLEKQGRMNDAITCYRNALHLQADYAEAHNNLGCVLQAARQFDDALICYRNALQIRPAYAEAHNNLGNVLQELGRIEEATACYRQALECNPAYLAAHANLGAALQALRRFEEAASCYRTILELDPRNRLAPGMLCNAALHLCDWDSVAMQSPALEERIAAGETACTPFQLLGFSESLPLQLACARNHVREHLPAQPPVWRGEHYAHDRIRVAYLSADFHEHATAYLMAELFEKHDASRFEIIGISFGPDDQSAIRARLKTAFGQFHDVRAMSDAQVATLLRELEIDIAVDLKGYTHGARPGILAHRPAPVQVSYLGYPGTMGAPFIDYIIADPTVLPMEHQSWYTERIVQLPDSYQVNDSHRTIARDAPTRTECGLPEAGFVFCCFNGSYKLTSRLIDIWMRLLRSVPGSVLWLLKDNETAQLHLRQAAASRGIAPERLVFAPRMRLDQHLARHRLADLFLDTLPINAHTTASDALWTGLPVLTCLGQAFAGRVAASLLRAAGMDELVTENLDDYEALAIRLATDGTRLRELRRQLERNRESCALFDTDRFRRSIEAAYQRMWERARDGGTPEAFVVKPE